MIDACAIPTAWVFVMAMGPAMVPDSSIHDMPVISPLPFWEWVPAAQGSSGFVRPRGWIAVTPVLTSSPSISVAYPTSTPGTSVMALLAPAVPAKGIPRARARGFPVGVSRIGVSPVMPGSVLVIVLRPQREGRIPVRHQRERVRDDPLTPSNDPFDEIEYAPGVPPGEQDREPGHDHDEEDRDPQERQDDEV